MKYFSTILVLLLNIPFLGAQTTAEKEIKAVVGEEFSDTLDANSSHAYIFNLDSAHLISGQVNQDTVDVVVTVFDPENEEMASFDTPPKSPESFQFKTELSGEYRVEVKAAEEGAGAYDFSITKAELFSKLPAGQINQFMAPYTGENVPGGAVMVYKDGEVLFSHAYGMANLTYNIPFETSTPTNIGSSSKQFTAFAIALLDDRGALSLDDDIRDYFPELPDFRQVVTIRHLLTHTSGYREYLNTLAMVGHNLSSPLDRQKVIEIVQKQPELQNEPGAAWNYNNTGYVLMSLLVERVTGTPFPEWMKENIFEPLNMNNTEVRKDQSNIIKGRSQGYTITEDGNFEEVTDWGGAMGAGGIYTTMDDLAKWVRNFKNPTLGNMKISWEMTHPFVLKNGDTTNYGLGMFVEDHNGLKKIHHGGSDVAHRSMLIYFPEIDAAVITQSNNASFDGNIADKIADIYFGEYLKRDEKIEMPPSDVLIGFNYDPENFEALTGRYELENTPGFTLSFFRDRNRIYGKATGQPEVNMKAISDSVFEFEGINAKVTFHLSEDKSANSLTLHQNGDHLAKRIIWKPGPEELETFTGQYFSDEIHTLYSVNLKDSTLVLEHFQVADIELTPADVDSFDAEFPITEVSFVRNFKGEITGFKASNGRSRGIFFKKQEFK